MRITKKADVRDLRAELLAAAVAMLAQPQPVAVPSLRSIARACGVAPSAGDGSVQPCGYRNGPGTAQFVLNTYTTNGGTADMAIYDVNLNAFRGDTKVTLAGGSQQAKGTLSCYSGDTVTVSIERWNGAWVDAESLRLTCP
ncbi:MAG TPA: hypothetical protein VGN81_18075 [Pseudonocardiaceae bacterium]